MFEWISNFLKWITTFWSLLPEETKNKLIAVVVTTYEEIFKAYYKANQTERENA